MNETDYRSLILVYQQKSADLLSQVVAFEAKLMVLNQRFEEQSREVVELKKEVESLKTKSKKTQPKTVIDAEGF